MRRETQNILLVLLGGALLKISLNGSFLRYVKPSQQPWLIAAGAVLVLLALVSIARDFRPTHAPADDHEHDGDHDHHHGRGRTTWLLLLPVLAIFLVTPPALGADSVSRAGDRVPAPPQAAASSDDQLADFPALPSGSPVADSLSDYTARAGWDRRRSLVGRPVRLTGFVVHQGQRTYLARLVIACCAADAYPVKVQLTGAGVEPLADDTWIETTVLLVPGSSTKATEWTPTATVTDVRRVAQPKDPYEY